MSFPPAAPSLFSSSPRKYKLLSMVLLQRLFREKPNVGLLFIFCHIYISSSLTDFVFPCRNQSRMLCMKMSPKKDDQIPYLPELTSLHILSSSICFFFANVLL